MSPSVSRRDAVDAGLIALATAAGLGLWARLPPEMAIHFSASGAPDTHVPRAVGVFLVPAVMITTLGIVRGVARVDPPDDERVFAVVSTGTIALLGAVHLFVLAWNLGYRGPPTAVAAAVVLVSFGLVGYAVVRKRLLSTA